MHVTSPDLENQVDAAKRPPMASGSSSSSQSPRLYHSSTMMNCGVMTGRHHHTRATSFPALLGSAKECLGAVLSQVASNTSVVLSTVPGILPLTRSLRTRNETARRDRELERCIGTQETVKPPDARDSESVVEPIEEEEENGSSDRQTNSGFFALPPEIRNQIMIQAFGQRTLHMSLEFQHPFTIATHKTLVGRSSHAKIQHLRSVPNYHLRTELPKEWTWFGCVCHQFPSPDASKLPGHLRCLGLSAEPDPGTDYCLEGLGCCNEWPGVAPTKCQVGTMGWLLTCRRSYHEGMRILYGTNTIRIASPALHQNLHNIFSKATLSYITSLELVWDPTQLALNLGFTSQDDASIADKRRPPIFPSMIRLCISFRGGNDIQRDEALGVDWKYRDETQLSQTLSSKVFPMIDDLVQRLVPCTTDVTVQCPNWAWYKAMDSFLLDKQGIQVTKPQRGDLGGLKCWRRTTSEQTASISHCGGIQSCDETEDVTEEYSRDGIWLHVGSKDVKLGCDAETYDHTRRELYGLEESEYSNF